MAIKKYIVNLPDYIENNEDYEILYNGVPMKPVPYEEPTDVYKETLEFLKVATKEDLMNVYGFSSLDSLFSSESVDDIVGEYKAKSDKYRRVLELLKDIDICELRSIVNDLYTANINKMQKFKDIIKTLKGEDKSESD